MTTTSFRFSLLINNVVVEETTVYATFIQRLRTRLGVRSSHNVRALAVQSTPPPGFADFVITATRSGGGTASVRFRLRTDNLYLLGFQRDGQWYEFQRPPPNKNKPSPPPIISGSKDLPFDCSYLSMTRAGGQSLSTTQIGIRRLDVVVFDLAANQGPQQEARSLIVVCFMICEAARFVPVLQEITRNNADFSIPTWMDRLVHSWSTYSAALFRADSNPAVPFQIPSQDVLTVPLNNANIEIKNLENIVSIMGILLGLCFHIPTTTLMSLKEAFLEASSSSSCSSDSDIYKNVDNLQLLAAPTQPQCYVGIPLLQVFSVGIDRLNTSQPNVGIYGTITISNGLSTRTIYNLPEDRALSSSRTTILPNEPISSPLPAFGPINLVLDLFLKVGQAAGAQLVTETLLWGAFSLGSPFDEVITRGPVEGPRGSVTAYYAVMRNAVAASVTFTIREASNAASEVYGQIYAHYDNWNDVNARSWLFNSTTSDYASVNIGNNIPLLSTAVAVPLTANSLRLTTKLTAYNRNSADDPMVDQIFDFPIPRSVPSSVSQDSRRVGRNVVRVTVSWSSGF